MSKKWITILVAALVAAMLPASAFAAVACKASVLATLQVHDKTAAKLILDPADFTPRDAIDGIEDQIAPVASGAHINGEGQAERISDLLIYDTGAGNGTPCFAAGTTFQITYNGYLTSPTVGSSLSNVNNLDVYDSNGANGLSITSSSITLAFAANAPQTIITITVGTAGTQAAADQLYGAGFSAGAHAGSALRIKNLRIDAADTVSGLLGTVNVNVATAAGTIPTILGQAGAAQTVVGTKFTTIATGSVVNPVDSTVAGAVGQGTQSSGKGLSVNPGFNLFKFTPGDSLSFRVASSAGTPCDGGAGHVCPSGVANDIATGATSMIFNLTGIPSGVTVTFPTTIDTVNANGAAGELQLTGRAGNTYTNAGAPGAMTLFYDTTKTGAALGGTVQEIDLADNADSGTAVGAGKGNPNCKADGVTALNAESACSATPKIGVLVGTTSLAGTAVLSVAFGPANPAGSATGAGNLGAVDAGPEPAGLPDDNATTGLIPRYNGAARIIVSKKNLFTINPVRTVLLYPFVSTIGGYSSGFAIANTCSDTGTYGATATCTQAGGVTFYFFGVDPNTKAAVSGSLNTDLNAGGTTVVGTGLPCRGFDAAGRVQPGTTAACVVSGATTGFPNKILPLVKWTGATPTDFDGYVIAVSSFNFGHGFSSQFDGHGNPFGANGALSLSNNAASRVVAGGESVGQ